MENEKIQEYRANIRMSEDLYNSVNYWAEKKNMKVADYIRDAIYVQIKRDNKDYDLPSLEAHRLNQIIDAIEAMDANLTCMQEMFRINFASLMEMANGTNYLIDHK